MLRVDLHTHSNASDGTLSPRELVDYAASKGLKAIALTDHDTISGIEEAMDEAKLLREHGVDIEVIPGIEVSSEYNGKDIHIVGLFIDYKSEFLTRRLTLFRLNRYRRNLQMCEKLTKASMPVKYEELEEEFKGAVITRAHYAKYLYKKGYVKSIKEAFDRFIGDRCPYYVARKKQTPERAVEIIRRAGGIPILAHPILYGMSKDGLERLVLRLKSAGLLGIEAIYSTYLPADERYIRTLANKYGLLLSGGSDFHGTNKIDIDLGDGKGKLFVPEEILDNIRVKHDEMKDAKEFRLPKILFTDLDGTLLRDDKTISKYTYDILKKWVECGHYIALCSGRDLNSVKMVYEQLELCKLDNIYLIGFNGGQIYDCKTKQTIQKKLLTKDHVKYIEELAKEMGVYVQAYSDTNIISKGQTKELSYYQKVIKTPPLFTDSISEMIGEGTCKCLAIELEDKDKIRSFKDKIAEYGKEHGIVTMFSNPYYLEIIPESSGKGTAVRELCKLINVENLISVGAGDEQNDISMLEACDIAIAMENGIDEIKEVSSSISLDTNDNDGLAKTLVDIM